MNRYFLSILSLIAVLCCNAQILDALNSKLYYGRVKLVSEFMQRFNREENNPYVDSTAHEVVKKNLCQLFDIEHILKNREIAEPQVFEFIDSTLTNDIKLRYSDAEWFAKVKCVGSINGEETTFSIYLTVEPRGKDMYKWVINDVEGKIFDLKPSRESDKIMLLPNEHESNFMRLNSITSEKDDYITLYSSSCRDNNRLTVLNTLIYYNCLNIDYVCDIEYTFLQVPGYIFTIKEFERESTNSGWLIKEWHKISKVEKKSLLQRIYNGKYSPGAQKETEVLSSTSTQQTDTTAAIAKVKLFVKYLNNYITNKSSSNEIMKLVKGRYTFIISDGISNQLCKYYKNKAQKSYRIDALLGWLGNVNSPIQSIHISNPEIFEDENIRPEYQNGYALIKCELSTKGGLQINEQVVFFIYGDQIAGVKFISDCY